MPIASSFGVTANLKATWEKLWKLSVRPEAVEAEVGRERADHAADERQHQRLDQAPRPPPAGRGKPIARSVAISACAAETAEYMQFSAPNAAPTAMNPATV